MIYGHTSYKLLCQIFLSSLIEHFQALHHFEGFSDVLYFRATAYSYYVYT